MIFFFDFAILANFFTFDLDLWPWPLDKVIVTWTIKYALLGCVLVPSMNYVSEIVSEICHMANFLAIFRRNFTLIRDLGLVKVTWFIECVLLGCTLVPGIKTIDEIAFEICPIFFFLDFGQF